MSGPQRLVELIVEGLERDFAPPKSLGSDYSPYGRVGTVLITDIRGWGRITRSIGDDSAAAVALEYRSIVKEEVKAHGGHTLDAVADTVIAVFERARDALVSAAAVREVLQTHEWQHDVAVEISTGVHTGRITAEDHAGLSVWHCQQLCRQADAGQILVSHSTEALLEGETLEGFELRDLGERDFPTSDSPRRVFELVVPQS